MSKNQCSYESLITHPICIESYELWTKECTKNSLVTTELKEDCPFDSVA